MSGDQLALFEPTGPEVGALALSHACKADGARRRAELAMARGWVSVWHLYSIEAALHEHEAECLAMLADLERLAGLS